MYINPTKLELITANSEAMCNYLMNTFSGINSQWYLKIRTEFWDFRFPKVILRYDGSHLSSTHSTKQQCPSLKLC